MAGSNGIEPQAPTEATASPVTPAAPVEAAAPAVPSQDELTAESRERVLAHLAAKRIHPDKGTPAQVLTDAAPATEKPTEAKEEPKPEEIDPAAAVLGMVKQARRLQEERKAAAKARADAEAEIAKARAAEAAGAGKWKPVEEAIARGDRLAAVKHLLGEGENTEKLFWDLVNEINGAPKAPGAPPVLDQNAVQKIALETIEKAQKERAAAEAAAAQERVGSAREQYVTAVATEFEAAKGNFPLVRALGVTSEQIYAQAEASFKRTGVVPEAKEILAHFEKDYAAKVGPVFAKQAPAAPPRQPVDTITSQITRDTGGAPGEAPKRLTVDDRLRIVKEKAKLLRG